MIYIYLCDDEIRIAEADVRKNICSVKKVYCSVDAHKYLVNGEVIDADGFVKFISLIWQEQKLSSKSASLVIHSPFVMSRSIEVPKMNDKKTQLYVEAQFKEIERIQDAVTSYYVIGEDNKKKTRQVFATVTDRNVMKNFIHLFGLAGIKIITFDDALSAMSRFVGRVKSLAKENCVALVSNGQTLTGLVFQGGRFVYSSENLVSYDHTTPEYGYQIAKIVSQLRQFLRANNMPSDIDNVYITENSSESFDFIDQSLAQIDENIRLKYLMPLMGINAPKELTDNFDISAYLYALSASVSTSNSGDLIKRYKFSDEDKRKQAQLALQVAIVGGLAMVLVAVSGALIFSNVLLQNKLDEVQAKIDNKQNIEMEKHYDDIVKQEAYLAAGVLSLKTARSNIESYPDCDSSVSAVISECAKGYVTADIVSYASDTGLVSINAYSPNEASINYFIANLLTRTEFSAIDYTGYTYQDESNRWKVNVMCYLPTKDKEEKVNN